jgi:hypothetical protein
MRVVFGTFTLLSLLVLCPNRASATFSAAPYFPLHTRNAWTYRVNGAMSNTTTVLPGTTNINGVATKALQDSDGSTAYYTNDGNGVRIHRESDPSQGITITFSPPVKIVNATTDIGQTVNSSGTASTNVGNFGYTASFTVEAFETSTVPLGSFPVVRLQGTLTLKGVVSESLTIYAASYGGIVKQINVTDTTLTSELTEVMMAVDCPADSLQAAVDNALSGFALSVAGNCSENILIRNEKQRLVLDGAGAGVGTRTTITGNSSNPSVNVRGKGILLQNFTITGGSNGVHINRGSNAVFNANVIQNSLGNGVLVDELAFAALTNNTIQNHPAAGVFVSEHSTARIGIIADSDSAASANTITNNTVGVVISNGSSARVIGNTISNNTGNGVRVLRDSAADIASNAISGNGGDGIEIGENSSVQLGEDSGTSIFESANTTSSLNTGVGIRCMTGGTADGRQGTLTGVGGATNFASSCLDGLLP